MDETSGEKGVGRMPETGESQALEAYSTIGGLYLRCDQRDDLLIERYEHLLDALWWRLTDQERASLAKAGI